MSTTNFGCDVLAINRDTSIFGSAGDACFKRRVVYRVINWCEYDGLTLQPTLIPRDIDCDGKLDECTWLRVDGGDVWLDDDDKPKDEPVISFKKEASSYQSLSCDDKTYSYTRGFWQYTQFIKVYDNEAPDILVNGDFEFCANGQSGAADCKAEVMISFIARDACTGTVDLRSVKLSLNGAAPKDLAGDMYTIEESRGSYIIRSLGGEGLPEGEHSFVISAADECGNLAGKTVPFKVVDCKTPAPICTSILSVDLMPVVEDKKVVGGMNEVWAVDFIASGVIDCTPHPKPDAIPGSPNNVRYYLVRQDSLLANSLNAPTEEYLIEEYRSVTFTCEDNGAAIAIFVIGVDGAGNFDFCTVMVNVQPGVDPDPCAPEPDTSGRVAVAGLINTAEGNAIEGVEVSLSGQLEKTIMTGEEGVFAFDELHSGYDYTITPSHPGEVANGLSTFDLVLMTKHILGVETLDSPYKLLAADVNNSQSVTALDLIQIRKLILSIDTKFKNTSSWIFIPKNYVFPDPLKPWDVEMPFLLNLNNLEEDMTTADFIGIKKGDVNGSAIANSQMAKPRNVSGVFQITTPDIKMQAGKDYTIDFSSEQLAQIQGYQFTMNFDISKLELVDLVYGVAKENNFGLTHLEEGIISTSWNSLGGLKPTKAALFSLIIRTKSNVQLSEVLGISSRYTSAEAYYNKNEQLDVHLSFDDKESIQSGFKLYQNTPNPFRNDTQIGFWLPETTDITLRIHDVNGKVIRLIQQKYESGEHQVRIEGLPGGVFYYTLESEGFRATKKMINIK